LRCASATAKEFDNRVPARVIQSWGLGTYMLVGKHNLSLGHYGLAFGKSPRPEAADSGLPFVTVKSLYRISHKTQRKTIPSLALLKGPQ
jgi:hypothetical protein